MSWSSAWMRMMLGRCARRRLLGDHLAVLGVTGQEELLALGDTGLGLLDLALAGQVDGSMKQLRAEPTLAMISKHAISILFMSSMLLLALRGIGCRILGLLREAGLGLVIQGGRPMLLDVGFHIAQAVLDLALGKGAVQRAHELAVQVVEALSPA